jgi:hypothetical protein
MMPHPSKVQKFNKIRSLAENRCKAFYCFLFQTVIFFALEIFFAGKARTKNSKARKAILQAAILAIKLFALASLVQVVGRVVRFNALYRNRTTLPPFFANEASKKV